MSRAHARSEDALAYRNLYGLKAWKRARAYQLHAFPLCALCHARGILTPANVVNHRKPHRGVMDLFLDPANLESLCKPCHDGPTQSFERTGVERGCNAEGFPNNARSHWRG